MCRKTTHTKKSPRLESWSTHAIRYVACCKPLKEQITDLWLLEAFNGSYAYQLNCNHEDRLQGECSVTQVKQVLQTGT